MKGIHGVDLSAGMPGGLPKPILQWTDGSK